MKTEHIQECREGTRKGREGGWGGGWKNTGTEGRKEVGQHGRKEKRPQGHMSLKERDRAREGYSIRKEGMKEGHVAKGSIGGRRNVDKVG